MDRRNDRTEPRSVRAVAFWTTSPARARGGANMGTIHPVTRAGFVTPLVLAALGPSLAGCPDHESGAKNGIDEVLYFSDVKAGDFGAVPLGAPWRVSVSHHTSGFEICEPSVAPHGAEKCSGGTESEPIVIESAVCETLACKIEIDKERSVVRFSSDVPGATRIRVTVKSKDDGETYSDAFTVRFAEAKRIEIRNEPYALLPVAMPIYAGIPFAGPKPRLVDADGNPLKVEPGVVSMKREGTSLEEPRPWYFRSLAPGVTKLTWDFRGTLVRSIDVEVIEPATEQELVVLPRVRQAISGRSDELENTVELDAFRAEIAAAASSVPMIERSTTPDNASYYHPVLVRLTDGRRVVVPLAPPEIVPADGVGTDLDPAVWCVTVYSRVPQSATLHLRAGAASRDVPVRFL